MYRVGSSIKKSNQIRVATTNVVLRSYSTEANNNNNNGESNTVAPKKKVNSTKRSNKERFSEFVDDDEVVIDYRKVVEKKKVVGEQSQDFDKMLAGLTMKELKLMRYRDNPETFELFKRQHFNINDAFNMSTTTKSLLEKQKQKQNAELPGSQFKTQKITYDKLSQVKSQHIANELNKFKDQFEKPLVEAYNEVTNQANLLYRTKRAEERLMKKKIEKSNKEYQLNSLERHYRDIVQVRNALDFRGKTVLAGFDEEDAWQRILERSEISDPHNLARLHMMDEYNDLGYQSEINEDYINQLSVVPFDYANPASYSSMVNLLDEVNKEDTYREPEELGKLLVIEKLLELQKTKPDSVEYRNLEKEIKNDRDADEYLASVDNTVPAVPQFSEEDMVKLTKDELTELKIIKAAAKRLQEYQDARDRVTMLENPTNQNLIDNYDFYKSMNRPTAENAKSTAQLLHVADISLKAGTRPLTEEEIVDLLPYDEEVVEDPQELVDTPIDPTQEEKPFESLPGAINKDFFDENGEFILDEVATTTTTETVEVASEPKEGETETTTTTTTTTTSPTIPTFDHLNPNLIKSTKAEETSDDATVEEFFNGLLDEEINRRLQAELRKQKAEADYLQEQLEMEHEDRDGNPDELINRGPPSTLPDFEALSAKIRKREEESLNAIANKYIDAEINEKTATEVLDEIYESYKTNNLFSKDIIEHDRNTIREANGDVAVPDSMYFEYDTTFRDLVDRDVLFKMPLKDTDLVRVLTHQLTESGLLKQEKVLKYTPDDMPVSKEMVEALPNVFPDFVKDIIDQDKETELSQEDGEQVTAAAVEEKVEEHDEIYDERRVYINLKPAVKDEGVITVPTVFKKQTNPKPLDEVDSNDGWLMGKPFDMMDYRLQGQPNKLPIDEDQAENDEDEDMDEPAPLIEELVDEEDEDFKDLTPGVDQEPELFEESDLYYYLQEGGNQEWFRPEKINDNDIALLERRQTWFPNQRQHISTYPFEFVSSHNTTDQTEHDLWVNRKAVLKVNVAAFNLPPTVEARLAELTANRFDPHKRVLTLVASNHKTLPENKYEVKRIFKELLHEANLADPNFVSVRTDNYQAPPPPSFVPSVSAKSQEKFNIYRLQGFPILNTQQKQHLELYSFIKSQLE